ncbi:hypothetical protein CHU98_g8708 [Xylaria longipes]|nr:hypothetical protein CHU98_g8708 [Xylaria longipes]
MLEMNGIIKLLLTPRGRPGSAQDLPRNGSGAATGLKCLATGPPGEIKRAPPGNSKRAGVVDLGRPEFLCTLFLVPALRLSAKHEYDAGGHASQATLKLDRQTVHLLRTTQPPETNRKSGQQRMQPMTASEHPVPEPDTRYLPVRARRSTQRHVEAMAGEKDPITCHVLDTSVGRPAKGIRVKLEGGHAPLKTFESQTDDDGRIKTWLPYSSAREAGDVPTYALEDVLSEVDDKSTWTLRFDTGSYFGDGDTFFPEVVVTFVVNKGQHYHVPLLLAPYSYTTYRGS